ncbi:MAG: D-alanyl-D-alanine carboxypeptidase [Methylococcales bacterium]|nr:D-alanyl-D-alanine carboxypeptidase [Methylococcales bacterium]
MRKKLLLTLNVVCLLLASQTGHARHAEILIDAENGNVLHEIEATQSWFPASLTKMMTLYITFDALNNGQIHLHDMMHASHHASQQPQSRLGLHNGERITVEEAILAIVTRSANDATVVLAEHLAVTEDNFAIRMTAKAHSMGMYNTYFMNATGLPNDWQVTTAHDMALLSLKLYRNFPEYYDYFSAHSFEFKGRELFGINRFTATYDGAEGMKTGFTCNSGYNLVSSASQNGRRFIGVVLGGRTSNERYNLMINQMDHGFGGDYNVITNLFTMPTQSAGLPPHQLSCASGGSHYEEPEVRHHRHGHGHHHAVKHIGKVKAHHGRHKRR